MKQTGRSEIKVVAGPYFSKVAAQEGESMSKSAMHEAVMCGLYEPTTYDPGKGTVTIPISAGHYEAVHALCAALGIDEGEILRGILESGIEGGIGGHMPRDIADSFKALFFDEPDREPYVLTWAKQRAERES